LSHRYWEGVLRLPSYFAARCGGASGNILKELHRAAEEAALMLQGA